LVAGKPRRIAWACAAAAVGVSGSAALITLAVNDWRSSALVRMSETDAIADVARSHDPDFVLFPPEGHFDGVYFYAIALDPLAIGDQHELIDLHPYRYGHAGYGWLGAAASLGNPAWVPLALLLVSLAAMGVAGWAASRIADLLDRSPWWGLLVAVNPGLVLSVTVLTSEPAGVAFASLGLLLWFRGRSVVAVVSLAAACLVKEPFALVPAGLFAWEVIEQIRHRAAAGATWRMLLLAVAVLPLAWWYLYLRLRFGVLPIQEAPDFFGAPFAGWYDSFGFGAHLVRTGASQLGTLVIPILTIVAAALVVATVRALRMRSPFDTIFLLVVTLATLYNYLLLGYPKDLVRELVIPLLLLPAVIGSVAWSALAPSAPPQTQERQEEASEHDLRPQRDRGH
jgi:hypothetical protein